MKDVIPKFIGAEIEFGNHFCESAHPEPFEAAVALFQASKGASDPSEDNDTGCRTGLGEFGHEGFRCYIDHGHFEIALPSTLDPVDLVLWQRRARQQATSCKKRAEERSGQLCVHAATTNRSGSAWGFHLNVLISRKTFDRWRNKNWRQLSKNWISFLVTSQILFGTGKVGTEKGTPPADYQLSQRADFIDCVVALETVGSKSLVNTRDEPLADPLRYARFHISAAFDFNLCEFASWLKFGTVQLMLAVVETEAPLPNLQLKEPLESLAKVSRDLDLSSQLQLADGSSCSLLDLQEQLAFAASRALDAGEIDDTTVPRGREIVNSWITTLDQLRRKNHRLIVRRLDWAVKKRGLDEWRRRLNISWSDPRLTELDLRYGELSGGWFEKLERNHLVDRLDDFLPGHGGQARPNVSQRDEARMRIIAKFGKSSIAAVDWEHVCVNAGLPGHPQIHKISLDDPLDAAAILEAVNKAKTVQELVKILPKQHCKGMECGPVRDLINAQPIFLEELP